MRAPSAEQLAANPALGALAIAEMTLVVLAHSLRASHSTVDRGAWPAEDPILATARQMVDGCDSLLRAIDYYRDALHDRRSRSSVDWPF